MIVLVNEGRKEYLIEGLLFVAKQRTLVIKDYIFKALYSVSFNTLQDKAIQLYQIMQKPWRSLCCDSELKRLAILAPRKIQVKKKI